MTKIEKIIAECETGLVRIAHQTSVKFEQNRNEAGQVLYKFTKDLQELKETIGGERDMTLDCDDLVRRLELAREGQEKSVDRVLDWCIQEVPTR